MILLLAFISIIQSSTISTVAYAIPSFSDKLENISIIYQVVYGVWLGLFLFFIVLRKPILSGIQKQAIIFQGLYFGVDLCIYTLTFTFSPTLSWILSLIVAPVAAILSVNDKFKNTFICLINGFAISYSCTLIFRISLRIQSGVILGAAFFVLHIFISGSEVFQTCFAKIFTSTVSVISLIDLFRIISIFTILHGGSDKNKAIKIITVLIAVIITILFSIYFVGMTYFSTWVDKKIEEIKTKVVKSPEEVQV